MSRCFVIQPFDRGKFEKRYNDIFAPAITDAELEPYRADKDPGGIIPIETIEAGIRDSVVCLADITTDNPNVWYELGYAIANGKDVVLICSSERSAKFPFDVQHRAIISYNTESTQDFDELKGNITARLRAMLEKQRELQTVSSLSPLKDTEGLSSHEVVALVSVMERAKTLESYAYMSEVLMDIGSAGYTEFAGTLSLQSLERKQMIKFGQTTLGNTICYVTERGVSWLIDNQNNLKLMSS